MTPPKSPKSEIEPIVIPMGDTNDDQHTGGAGDDSDGGGGEDEIDPPPTNEFRVYRLPGRTLW